MGRSAWVRYGAAVVITLSALGLKLFLVPLLTEDEPFLLFFAAVIASAACGLGPGLVATALAAMTDNYFFVPPLHQFGFSNTHQKVRLVIFIAEGVVISMVFARLKAARRHAETSESENRTLERRILEISDEEQRRIGHDLHDGLGQQLTGITLIARHLEHRLANANSPDAQEASKVAGLAKSAVEWTHDLCRSLSPPALESSGLPEALRQLAANAESIFRIDCTFEQSGEVEPIDLASGVHLYRIAQEAISNAVRHGNAKHVRLQLQNHQIQIIDDGTGIEPDAQPAEGMGLRIMRYRAKMIGAAIEVRARESGGTLVSCRYNNGSN